MLYTQSTTEPVWLYQDEKHYFCQHTINTKNMYMLELVYSQIFKNRLEKWVKHKQNYKFIFCLKY